MILYLLQKPFESNILLKKLEYPLIAFLIFTNLPRRL